MKINIKGPIVPNSEGWIYSMFGLPYTSPGLVLSSISEAEHKMDKLDVFINSGGGDVFSGSEIYSALRSYPGQVNIHVVGLAASAASVIAMAGHSDISPTAQLMVHNVSCQTCGDYHEMDSSSEMLKKANRAIASAYVEKTGMSEQDALDLMDCETWLTASDAVAYGLIDEVTKSQNIDNCGGFVSLQNSVNEIIPHTIIDSMIKRKANLINFFTKKED